MSTKKRRRLTRKQMELNWAMPLVFEEEQVGSINISILPDKGILDNPELVMSYLGVLNYLGHSLRLLKEEIELDGMVHEDYLKPSPLRLAPFFSFWRSATPFSKVSEIVSYLYITDEALIKYIESSGPIFLRTLSFQGRMKEWIANPSILGTKLNQVMDALLRYAKVENKLLRPGKPPSSLSEKIGRQIIKDIYVDVRSVLYKAKKLSREKAAINIGELIKKSYKEYCIDELKRISSTERTEDSERQTISLKSICINLDKYQNPIAMCLEHDKLLRDRFVSLDWYPKDFAKEMLASMFKMSLSSIEKYLRPSHR